VNGYRRDVADMRKNPCDFDLLPATRDRKHDLTFRRVPRDRRWIKGGTASTLDLGDVRRCACSRGIALILGKDDVLWTQDRGIDIRRNSPMMTRVRMGGHVLRSAAEKEPILHRLESQFASDGPSPANHRASPHAAHRGYAARIEGRPTPRISIRQCPCTS
jgi:hypothetical protein